MKILARLSPSFFLLLYCACTLLFFVFIAEERFIARDEGFYLYAAKLVAKYGQTPTLDFFYPQSPLTPYLYGLWMKLSGFSWDSARLFSCLVSALLATGILAWAYRAGGALPAVFCGLGFPLSNFIFPWFTLGKAYSLTAFFLVLSLYLFWEAEKKIDFEEKILGRFAFLFFCSGLSLACAIQTRLYIAGLFPLFFIALCLFSLSLKKKRLGLIAFLVGLSCGLLPFAFIFLSDFSTAYFNNLGYHLLRRNDGPEIEMAKKWKVLPLLFGLQKSQQFHHLLLPLCLWGSILAFAHGLGRRKQQARPLSFFLSLFVFALTAISFLPTPIYIQYFCLVFPLALLCTSFFLGEILSCSLWTKKFFIAASIILICVYILPRKYIRQDIEQFTKTGRGVIGIGNDRNARTWRIAPIEEFSTAIDKAAHDGEEVLTSWPGFFVSTTKARVAHRYENHFGLYIGDDVSTEERERFLIKSWSDMEIDIRQGTYRLLALENRFVNRKMLEAIEHARYTKIAAVEQFSLYEKEF